MSVQNPKIKALRDAEAGSGGDKSNVRTPLIRRDSVQHLGEVDEEQKNEYGEKTIGFFGGFALAVNNITGPAMVSIPVLFQQAGWLTPIVLMFMFTIVGTFAATMLCEAMARVPGNRSFDKRIELTSVAHYFLPSWGYHLTQFLMIFSLQSVNITSIIVSAQTMDLTLIAIFGKTCGFEFYPAFKGVCPTEAGTGISPFGEVFVISLGFLVVMVLILPFGYFNLDDSIFLQIASFCVLCSIMVEWVIDFSLTGLVTSRVPMISENQLTVLGTIMFNYAFVTSVPSWVNEKKPEVSIQKSMWYASTLSTLMFIIVGFWGGWALEFSGNEDLLNGVNDTVTALHSVSRISVYLFPPVVLLSSIPVFSIIVRYNLIENKICGHYWALFWSAIFPWVVSVPFYTGSGLTDVINWSALFVNGVVNFIIPLWIYVESQKALRNQDVDMDDVAGQKDSPSVELETDFVAFPDDVREKYFSWVDPMRMAQAFVYVTGFLIFVVIVLDIIATSLGMNVV